MTQNETYTNKEMLSWMGYFSDQLQVSPEKIKLLNICGKKKNVLPSVDTHKRILIFADQNDADLFYRLWDAGFGEVQVWYGQGDAPASTIKQGAVKDFVNESLPGKSAILFVNENAREASRFGIRNENFSRGPVRYVGHEIRAVIMNMISCDVQDTICIVSGESIVIEAAIAASEGTIIAVENDAGSMRTMAENVEKFGVTNVAIIPDLSEESLATVPVPRLAFIVATREIEGEIVSLLKKNPKMQFIIYTLELDILSELKTILERHNIETKEILQIAVAKTDKNSVFVAQPAPWMVTAEPRA